MKTPRGIYSLLTVNNNTQNYQGIMAKLMSCFFRLLDISIPFFLRLYKSEKASRFPSYQNKLAHAFCFAIRLQVGEKILTLDRKPGRNVQLECWNEPIEGQFDHFWTLVVLFAFMLMVLGRLTAVDKILQIKFVFIISMLSIPFDLGPICAKDGITEFLSPDQIFALSISVRQ